jgi:membrane protein DedA with SNARE-associated domain
MAQVVRHGWHTMGKVSIWAQWLMIATGVLLSPVLVLFLGWLIGWPRIRRLWPRRE